VRVGDAFASHVVAFKVAIDADEFAIEKGTGYFGGGGAREQSSYSSLCHVCDISPFDEMIVVMMPLLVFVAIDLSS
jgi:hypothetical protein